MRLELGFNDGCEALRETASKFTAALPIYFVHMDNLKITAIKELYYILTAITLIIANATRTLAKCTSVFLLQN